MNYEEVLTEFAHDEADDVVKCLLQFRQTHESCHTCSVRDFCDVLLKKLTEIEKKEAEG
jgi:hypothetical protein